MANPMDDIEQKIKHIIWGVVGMVILLIIMFGSFFIVGTDQRAVLVTFGKVNMNAIGDGLHMKLPLVQGVIKYDIKTQKYTAEASASSKDLQIITATVATNYHISPDKVADIHISLGPNYADTVIQPLEQESVKATTAKYNAEELITKREQVRLDIKDLLLQKLKDRNIIVEDVSITNFKFSDQFDQAIEAKVTAEQNALKEQNNLQVVQFQAQQVVAKAKGESQAIEIINEQLKQSPQYINYLTIQKWDGKMPLALGSGTLLSIASQNQS